MGPRFLPSLSLTPETCNPESQKPTIPAWNALCLSGGPSEEAFLQRRQRSLCRGAFCRRARERGASVETLFKETLSVEALSVDTLSKEKAPGARAWLLVRTAPILPPDRAAPGPRRPCPRSTGRRVHASTRLQARCLCCCRPGASRTLPAPGASLHFAPHGRPGPPPHAAAGLVRAAAAPVSYRPVHAARCRSSKRPWPLWPPLGRQGAGPLVGWLVGGRKGRVGGGEGGLVGSR